MFWITSAILVAIALAFILTALFKSGDIEDKTRLQNIAIAKEQLAELELRFEKGSIDQHNYQLTRDEIELSLFNDLKGADQHLTITKNHASRFLDALPILLLIPLITIPVYLNIGNLNFTQQLDSKESASKVARASMPVKADGTPDVEKIAQNLKNEMDQNPTDPKGWYMLGRTYMMLQRFPEAAESFDKSLSLRPDLSETMLSLADALSMSNNGQLVGRPRILVNKALSIDPENVTALWLSGMAASQENDFLEAIEKWKKVLLLLDDKPDEKKAVQGLIAEAKSRLSPVLTKDVTNSESASIVRENSDNKETGNLSVNVSISLSENLRDQVLPEDFVFVYAKAMNGPPMPLAAVRKQVKDLPLTLILNDEMAMMPSLKLSAFKLLSVGARISKTGQPIAKEGDLFSEKTDIKIGESITLEINEIIQSN